MNWDESLNNGKTAREIVSEMAAERTDRAIATELARFGFEVTPDAIRSVRRRMGIIKSIPNPELSAEEPVLSSETQEMKGDSWSISVDRTPIENQDDFIKAYKIDTRIWEIAEFRISRQEVLHGTQAIGEGHDWSRGGDGEYKVAQLNNIRAILKKKKHVEFALKEINALREKALSYTPSPAPAVSYVKPTGNMLELCLPDMHFGKVGWEPQTGYEDFDVKIAKSIFNEAIASLLQKSQPYQFEKILFVLGNDVFHTDNTENTTFSGTQLDGDTRYHRTFEIVRDVMVDTIDSLRQIAPVEVIVVPGNHDKMTAWHLGDSVKCWFHGYQDVTVNNAPMGRKYVRWGNVLLLFAHGDKGKRVDYPKLMASERRKDWGETIFHEIHTGDKHMTRVEESFGTMVRILPSLSGTDAWHSENMFVGSQRRAEAFVWNKDDGLLGTAIYTYRGK